MHGTVALADLTMNSRKLNRELVFNLFWLCLACNGKCYKKSILIKFINKSMCWSCSSDPKRIVKLRNFGILRNVLGSFGKSAETLTLQDKTLKHLAQKKLAGITSLFLEQAVQVTSLISVEASGMEESIALVWSRKKMSQEIRKCDFRKLVEKQTTRLNTAGSTSGRKRLYHCLIQL